MEVHHQVEAAAPKFAQEAEELVSEWQNPQPAQTRTQGFPGEHYHFIDPMLRFEHTRGGALHEPSDVCARVSRTKRRSRRQRAHHVAYRAQADHENSIGSRRGRERAETSDDGTPRAGEASLARHAPSPHPFLVPRARGAGIHGPWLPRLLDDPRHPEPPASAR